MSVLEKTLKSNVLLLWIQNIFILFSNGVFPSQLHICKSKGVNLIWRRSVESTPISSGMLVVVIWIVILNQKAHF